MSFGTITYPPVAGDSGWAMVSKAYSRAGLDLFPYPSPLLNPCLLPPVDMVRYQSSLHIADFLIDLSDHFYVWTKEYFMKKMQWRCWDDMTWTRNSSIWVATAGCRSRPVWEPISTASHWQFFSWKPFYQIPCLVRNWEELGYHNVLRFPHQQKSFFSSPVFSICDGITIIFVMNFEGVLPENYKENQL